ncbi:MAG: L,D-transpeptidase family protein [Alphaproteobacteria bacterium]
MSLSVNCRDKTISFGGQIYPCRIGRGGYIDGHEGREGDEKTPLGDYHVRFGLYRKDHLPVPNSPLTFRAIRNDDGWCDAVDDAAYNRFVRLPYAASHENLWREDGAYDIVLVISHNDSPPKPNAGSAVFIHIAQPDDRETLGCIALSPDVMIRLLPHLKTGLPVRFE